MPSTLVHNGDDGPLAKRQKLSNGTATTRPAQGSRIFTPFRVSKWSSVLYKEVLAEVGEDNWFSFPYESSLHISTAGEDLVPDHDLGGKMSSNLRHKAWLEFGIPHKTTDSRKYYGCAGMEGQSLCCMVWGIAGISARDVGVQEREEN